MKDFHLINWTMEVAKDLTASPTVKAALPAASNVQDNAEPDHPRVSGVVAEPMAKPPERRISGKSPEAELLASTVTPESAITPETITADSKSTLRPGVPPIHARRALNNRAIDLRWVLRDIAADRFRFSPMNRLDLQILIESQLVEIRAGVPCLTDAGKNAIA